MEKYRVGLVGCGGIAQVHGEALSSLEGVELLACADIRPERAQAFAGKFGGRAYPSLEAMLAGGTAPVPAHLHPPLPAHPHGRGGRPAGHPRVHRKAPGDRPGAMGPVPGFGAGAHPGGGLLPEPLQRQRGAAPAGAGLRGGGKGAGGPGLCHLAPGGSLLHRKRLAGQP